LIGYYRGGDSGILKGSSRVLTKPLHWRQAHHRPCRNIAPVLKFLTIAVGREALPTYNSCAGSVGRRAVRDIARHGNVKCVLGLLVSPGYAVDTDLAPVMVIE
jgi:hypothetical protein